MPQLRLVWNRDPTQSVNHANRFVTAVELAALDNNVKRNE